MASSYLMRMADFQLASLALLTAAAAIGSLIRQPAKRLAIAWATALGLGLLLGLATMPRWSLWSLAGLGASELVTANEVSPHATGTPSSLRREVPASAETDHSVEGELSGMATRARIAEITSFDVTQAGAKLVLPLYLGGTVAAVGWLWIGRWLAWRLVSRAAEADMATKEVVENLTDNPPRLLVSDRLAGPVALGIIRPSILLPRRLIERSDAVELRTVLAHELAHVQGGDLWLLAGLRMFLVVLWCNPLYWLLRRRVRIDQESLADAAAADQTDRHAYAARLLDWARELTLQPYLGGAAGLWESPSQLRKRIALLLDDRFVVLRKSSPRWRAACLISFLATAIFASLVTLGAAEPHLDRDAPVQTAQGLTYSGVVVDKQTGKPIEGVAVLVRLKTSAVHPWPTLGETTYPTDAQGKYQFTITPEQMGDSHLYIEVEATHPDYARKSPSGYALSMIRKNQELGEEPFFARIELRPAEPIYGVLHDPDGQPVDGVKVVGYSKEDPRDLHDYGSFASTESNEGGQFRLNVVAGGHSIVWILPRDFAPETHVLKERKGDLGTIQLQQGLKLSGRVIDVGGEPIAGVWVNAELLSGPAQQPIDMPVADQIVRTALTDEEGRYVMQPLPAGTYKVLPEEIPSDSTARDRTPRPLPATFMPRTFELSDDHRRLDIQASESVVLRARTVSSDGKPTRGHGFHFAGWIREDGSGFYSRIAEPDPQGNVEIRVPKGLKKAQLTFMTNEHGALRVRLDPDKPLVGKREVDLGTLDRDYDQIEIVRYNAPILVVSAIDAAGRRLDDVTVSVVYENASLNKDHGVHFFGAGADSDVSFEHQQDDRWRSSQLLPDEPFELRVVAQGKELPRQRLELKEGVIREVKITLDGEEVHAPAP
jgi:beta-lactamase regulating signal transducer with metallopeptidase domain